MIAQVLEVLRLDDIGKARHADMIQQLYYEEIDRHKLCEKCHTGNTAQWTKIKQSQSTLLNKLKNCFIKCILIVTA